MTETEKPKVVAVICGVTDDLERVSMTITVDGVAMGWAEFTPEQCDHHTAMVQKYKGLLRPAKPALNS